MKQEELKEHIFLTYLTVRIGAALVALIFPLVLWFGGLVQDIELQDSMSSYYHAERGSMRDWFVGILFTIGIILYLYKGYTRLENIVLNVAGALALMVALIPMAWGCGDDCPRFSLHGTLALGFFLCIAFVCIFCAAETLEHLEDEQAAARYRRAYFWLGVAMIISPLIAVVLNVVLRADAFVFFVELVGVWVFSIFWWVKAHEIKRIRSEVGIDAACNA